jgi:hypothetical protein
VPPLVVVVVVGGGGPPRGEWSEEGSHRIVGILLLLGSRDSGRSHGMGEAQRVLDSFLFFFFFFFFFFLGLRKEINSFAPDGFVRFCLLLLQLYQTGSGLNF